MEGEEGGNEIVFVEKKDRTWRKSEGTKLIFTSKGEGTQKLSITLRGSLLLRLLATDQENIRKKKEGEASDGQKKKTLLCWKKEKKNLRARRNRKKDKIIFLILYN